MPSEVRSLDPTLGPIFKRVFLLTVPKRVAVDPYRDIVRCSLIIPHGTLNSSLRTQLGDRIATVVIGRD